MFAADTADTADGLRESFLYIFKAPPPGPLAQPTRRTASAPLRLPLRRRNARSGRRDIQNSGGRHRHTAVTQRSPAWRPPAPGARLFRVGPESAKTSPSATTAQLRALTEPARKSRTSDTYQGQGEMRQSR